MKILHAPQHMSENLDENLETILRIKPTIAGLSEQDSGDKDNVDRIEKKVGHAYHVCAAPKGMGPHSREIIILVRKSRRRKVLAVKPVRIADKVYTPPGAENPGIGNDRYMLTVIYEDGLIKKRKKAHVLTHWHAVIQQRETGALLDNARANAMDKSGSPKLEANLRTLVASDILTTGDADFNWNMSKPKAKTWRKSPEHIFLRTKQQFKTEGLDWVWWTNNLKAKKVEVIRAGTGGNHSDHPWILVELV